MSELKQILDIRSNTAGDSWLGLTLEFCSGCGRRVERTQWAHHGACEVLGSVKVFGSGFRQ